MSNVESELFERNNVNSKKKGKKSQNLNPKKSLTRSSARPSFLKALPKITRKESMRSSEIFLVIADINSASSSDSKDDLSRSVQELSKALPYIHPSKIDLLREVKRKMINEILEELIRKIVRRQVISGINKTHINKILSNFIRSIIFDTVNFEIDNEHEKADHGEFVYNEEIKNLVGEIGTKVLKDENKIQFEAEIINENVDGILKKIVRKEINEATASTHCDEAILNAVKPYISDMVECEINIEKEYSGLYTDVIEHEIGPLIYDLSVSALKDENLKVDTEIINETIADALKKLVLTEIVDEKENVEFSTLILQDEVHKAINDICVITLRNENSNIDEQTLNEDVTEFIYEIVKTEVNDAKIMVYAAPFISNFIDSFLREFVGYQIKFQKCKARPNHSLACTNISQFLPIIHRNKTGKSNDNVNSYPFHENRDVSPCNVKDICNLLPYIYGKNLGVFYGRHGYTIDYLKENNIQIDVEVLNENLVGILKKIVHKKINEATAFSHYDEALLNSTKPFINEIIISEIRREKEYLGLYTNIIDHETSPMIYDVSVSAIKDENLIVDTDIINYSMVEPIKKIINIEMEEATIDYYCDNVLSNYTQPFIDELVLLEIRQENETVELCSHITKDELQIAIHDIGVSSIKDENLKIDVQMINEDLTELVNKIVEQEINDENVLIYSDPIMSNVLVSLVKKVAWNQIENKQSNGRNDSIGKKAIMNATVVSTTEDLLKKDTFDLTNDIVVKEMFAEKEVFDVIMNMTESGMKKWINEISYDSIKDEKILNELQTVGIKGVNIKITNDFNTHMDNGMESLISEVSICEIKLEKVSSMFLKTLINDQIHNHVKDISKNLFQELKSKSPYKVAHLEKIDSVTFIIVDNTIESVIDSTINRSSHKIDWTKASTEISSNFTFTENSSVNVRQLNLGSETFLNKKMLTVESLESQDMNAIFSGRDSGTHFLRQSTILKIANEAFHDLIQLEENQMITEEVIDNGIAVPLLSVAKEAICELKQDMQANEINMRDVNSFICGRNSDIIRDSVVIRITNESFNELIQVEEGMALAENILDTIIRRKILVSVKDVNHELNKDKKKANNYVGESGVKISEFAERDARDNASFLKDSVVIPITNETFNEVVQKDEAGILVENIFDNIICKNILVSSIRQLKKEKKKANDHVLESGVKIAELADRDARDNATFKGHSTVSRSIRISMGVSPFMKMNSEGNLIDELDDVDMSTKFDVDNSKHASDVTFYTVRSHFTEYTNVNPASIVDSDATLNSDDFNERSNDSDNADKYNKLWTSRGKTMSDLDTDKSRSSVNTKFYTAKSNITTIAASDTVCKTSETKELTDDVIGKINSENNSNISKYIISHYESRGSKDGGFHFHAVITNQILKMDIQHFFTIPFRYKFRIIISRNSSIYFDNIRLQDTIPKYQETFEHKNSNDAVFLDLQQCL